MRYLVCLLVGLLAGAVLASTAASALQRRNAVPRALMTLMQHDLAAARGATHSAGCTVDELPTTRASLLHLAGKLERTVLAPGTRDRVFVQYADDLRATLSRWNPEGACPAQAQALVDVDNACKACHRDYR